DSTGGRQATREASEIRENWVVGLLAIVGAVLLARRPSFGLVVLLAPIAMVVCVAIVTYGGTRFRYAAEPSLVVLAAAALLAAGERAVAAWRERRAAAGPAQI